MKTLTKILYKSSKFILFGFGTILVSGTLALGVFGKMYQAPVKDFLNTNIEKANSILDEVSTKLDEANNFDWNSIISEIDKIKPIIKDAKNDLSKQKENLNTLITKLQGMIDDPNYSSQKQTLEEIKSTLVDINDNVVGNENDTLSSGKQTCFAILNEMVNLTQDTNGIFNVNNLKQTFDNLLSTINNVLNPIGDFIKPLSNQEKVNSTYDTTSNVLLAVGGTILGLIVIGGLLSIICYKRIDGKLVNRFNTKKEIQAHISKILKKYPNVANGLVYKKSHLFKFRIPIILKNMGIWPAYVFGGLFFVGMLAGGVVATSQKNLVSNTLTTSSNLVSNINKTATDVNSQVDEVYTKVFDTNNSSSLLSQFNSSITKLKEMKTKLDGITTSSSQQIEDIKKTLNTVISQVQSINSSVNGQTSTINSAKDQINNLIGEDGSVTNALSEIENTINEINKPNSKEWHYYDLTAKILIGVGASIIAITILSSILMLILFKRVDGVAISRSGFKKHLASHLDKLFKKFPKLWDHFQRRN